MAGDRCVVCGYAKLPQTSAAAQIYQIVTIVTLVDKTRDVVEKASITLVTPVARNFVEELLVGSNLITDQERILEELYVNYIGGAQKAIKQAYRDLCDRYLEMKRTEDERKAVVRRGVRAALDEARKESADS